MFSLKAEKSCLAVAKVISLSIKLLIPLLLANPACTSYLRA